MLLLSRNYVFRVYSFTHDYSGPAEQVQLVKCQLTSDYPAKEHSKDLIWHITTNPQTPGESKEHLLRLTRCRLTEHKNWVKILFNLEFRAFGSWTLVKIRVRWKWGPIILRSALPKFLPGKGSTGSCDIWSLHISHLLTCHLTSKAVWQALQSDQGKFKEQGLYTCFPNGMVFMIEN